MIYLTSAANDQELLPLFGDMAIVLPIQQGDFLFWGLWENGVAIRVSGERKRLADMRRCIDDGRYLSQYQAVKEVGIDFLFLIIEGIYRPSPVTGLVEVLHGNGWSDMQPAIDYHRWQTYLAELSWYLGVQVFRSTSAQETVRIVKAIYLMFQSPPDKHGSLRQIYTEPLPRLTLLGQRPSLVRRVAKELPGIGWSKSQAAEKSFPTVRAMVNASIEDWDAVEGIGPIIARRVVEALDSAR